MRYSSHWVHLVSLGELKGRVETIKWIGLSQLLYVGGESQLYYL